MRRQSEDDKVGMEVADGKELTRFGFSLSNSLRIFSVSFVKQTI